MNECRLSSQALRQIVSRSLSFFLRTKYEDDGRQPWKRRAARQGTSKQLCGFDEIPTVPSCMFVTNKNEPFISCLYQLTFPSTKRLPPLAFFVFFAYLLAHSQLHKANEQFEMALWTLEMNRREKKHEEIYLWCMSFRVPVTNYNLSAATSEQVSARAAEGEWQLSRSNNIHERVILIEHKFRIGKSICIWIFRAQSYSTW